jgi:hypothetical protein
MPLPLALPMGGWLGSKRLVTIVAGMMPTAVVFDDVIVALLPFARCGNDDSLFINTKHLICQPMLFLQQYWSLWKNMI